MLAIIAEERAEYDIFRLSYTYCPESQRFAVNRLDASVYFLEISNQCRHFGVLSRVLGLTQFGSQYNLSL